MDEHTPFQSSHDQTNCTAQLSLRVIQCRWKQLILRELLDGVLQRAEYPQVPPRVDDTSVPWVWS